MGKHTAVQVEALPSVALRPYVASYVGFELRGFPPGIHLGTPGRSLTVIVSLSEPLDVVDARDSAQAGGRFEGVASGLMSTSVPVRHGGEQHGIRLSLTPLGARAIFGLPSAALTNELVQLEDVLGRLGGELIDRLRSATTWKQRFGILNSVLMRAHQQRAPVADGRQVPRAEIEEAWRRLVIRRGRVRIGSLATELGWSRRHLVDQFRMEMGMTPKHVARILRFEHAHQLATEPNPGSWTQISAAAGYADQAHLVREWCEFTGRTPTAWRRGEVLPA